MSIYLLDSTSKYAHMKRLLVIFFIFPVFAFIIPKKKNAASLGLLTKITSDTIKGQFNQIKIGYDPLKRVVSITQTSNQLDTLNKTGAKKNISNQLYKQEFIYEGNNIFPFSRKITSHKYAEGNKKNQVFAYLLQYFKYAKGQRIGDRWITILKDEK